MPESSKLGAVLPFSPVQPQQSPDAAVNEHVQSHAAQSDWEHAKLGDELTAWFTRFNERFFFGFLPPAAISIDYSRPEVLGTYRYGRDGLALKHRINLNSLHVDRGPASRLETLLHEMVHQWEEVVHGKEHGTRYHTVAFRVKAAELGIPTHKEGFSLGATKDGPFARLLADHGIDLEDKPDVPLSLLFGLVPASPIQQPPPVQPVAPTKSRLAKWTCGCTSMWASGGIEVDAVCRRCGNPFERATVVKSRRKGSR